MEQVDDFIERARSGDYEAAYFGLIELDRDALPALQASYRAEPDPEIRALLVEAIWQQRQPSTIDFLAVALHDPDAAVWKQALDGLVCLGSPEARRSLQHAAGAVVDDRRLAWIGEAIEQVEAALAKPESRGGRGPLGHPAGRPSPESDPSLSPGPAEQTMVGDGPTRQRTPTMATATTTETDAPPTFETLADVLDHLGGIPPDRVRLQPGPGAATEADIVAVGARTGRLYELIDGMLVEKGMSYDAGYLAGSILILLSAFVDPRNLGLVNGPDAAIRLFPGLVRIPDVSYVSWARIPGGVFPRQPIPSLVPDLAVEVLSPSNTPREMAIKRGHYFQAGVRIVWIVDPEGRTVDVYTDPDTSTHLDASGTLDGGDVLPDFALPLGEQVARLDRVAPR